MRLIETEIQIKASPETVWSVLTKLDKYVEWNPFIKNAKGEVRVGEKLEVCISPPNGKQMIFKPTVKTVVVNSDFSWLGRFLLPGIFDGRHLFKITPTENGCLLVQKEEFSGLLVPFLWGSLDQDTRAGFELMNSALKRKAESKNT
ncbi:MAG: SRPBCC domain-containing protein [Arenicellales bacterium]